MLVAFLVGGCGLTSSQKAAVNTFGKSVSAYGDTVGSIAPGALKAIEQMRVDNLSLATPSSRKEFDHVADRIPSYIHNPKAHSHVVLVVKLARALDEYGDALVDLVDYGDADERLEIFAGMAENLDEAFGTPIAKDQATATGHAASFVATQVLEAIKRGKIADIVRAYEPGIKEAAALLKAEFEGDREGTLFFAYNAALLAFQTRMTPVEHHAEAPDPDAKVWDGPASLSEAEGRRQIVAAQREYTLQKAAFEALKKEGLASTAALVKAHEDLVATMSKNTASASAIADFAKATASLSAEFKSGK